MVITLNVLDHRQRVGRVDRRPQSVQLDDGTAAGDNVLRESRDALNDSWIYWSPITESLVPVGT